MPFPFSPATRSARPPLRPLRSRRCARAATTADDAAHEVWDCFEHLFCFIQRGPPTGVDNNVAQTSAGMATESVDVLANDMASDATIALEAPLNSGARCEWLVAGTGDAARQQRTMMMVVGLLSDGCSYFCAGGGCLRE